jgi:nicotinamidase-related amidase
MLNTRILTRSALAAAGALIIAFAASFAATDIVEDWDTVKPPPKPEVKAVKLDPSTTALLILDMSKDGACKTRPRCMATIPNVKRLHDAAQAAGVMLWYSIGAKSEPADMIGPGFAPRDGEWAHQGGPDKFLGSNLEEKLKGRGVKTVVVCGTSFQGVGVGTGTEAAQRGYKVIVPIDCLSSEDPYMEQYSAWHFFKGGPAVVTGNSTLTRSTMVKFGN